MMAAALADCPGWLVFTAGLGVGAFPRRVWRAYRRYVERREAAQ
jgi:hypothetical protein